MASKPITRKATVVRRIGLSSSDEARLKAKLRRRAPSEPWVEAQFRTIEETDARGRPIARRLHDASVFPPGGARTAMVRCAACDVYTPPQTVEDGQCMEHAEHTGWGPSPSAQAIWALQYFNTRIDGLELAPESSAALRKEIRRVERLKRMGAK